MKTHACQKSDTRSMETWNSTAIQLDLISMASMKLSSEFTTTRDHRVLCTLQRTEIFSRRSVMLGSPDLLFSFSGSLSPHGRGIWNARWRRSKIAVKESHRHGHLKAHPLERSPHTIRSTVTEAFRHPNNLSGPLRARNAPKVSKSCISPLVLMIPVPR
ncbi:hypothetical protein BDV39DRAFT_180556 [Aspergillus sergii]|uniref:Uncharacterized protein n=1 Tax=Aspergillus sergii TaxID=1034303 RepID=A0A5N6WTR1_9EURO|nr:hypothetical protein BDV39DRAFT_180556 [Aspergillus sergii]